MTQWADSEGAYGSSSVERFMGSGHYNPKLNDSALLNENYPDMIVQLSAAAT